MSLSLSFSLSLSHLGNNFQFDFEVDKMLEAADYKDKSGEDFRQMMADEQVMMIMTMVMMMMAAMTMARIVMIMVVVMVSKCIQSSD